jgi:hypothetical protein
MASLGERRNRRFLHFAQAYQHLVNHGFQRHVNHAAEKPFC